MKTYQDRYTMWHDREVTNGEPRSNNPWIYSAYAQYLAPGTVDNSSRFNRYLNCVRSSSPILIDREPGRTDFPISKDEIIGMVSSGLLGRYDLSQSNWNFCNLEGKFNRKLTIMSFLRAVIALFKIRKEHRNYFWQNKMVETYVLAFYLPPWDQYYVNRHYKRKSSIFQYLAFYANAASVLTKGNRSVRMLLFLQLSDMNHWLLRFVPKNKYVKDYFEEDHPFVRNLK